MSRQDPRFKKKVFLTIAIKCPSCGHLIEKLPHGMQEVIADLNKLVCDKCGEHIVVRLFGGQKWSVEDAPVYNSR